MANGTQTDRNESGTTESEPVILQLGNNPTLLTVRARVLALTGVPVECTEDFTGVDALLDRYTHGLLVLCHSVSPSHQTEVLRRVRQRRPNFKHLVIAREGTERSPEETKADSVCPRQGPRLLLLKVDQLLRADPDLLASV